MNQTITRTKGEARMSFGETLARLRKEAGLSQTGLALKAGIAIDTLRRWEQNRNLPQIDDAYRLAKAIGIDVGELILGEDMEPTEEPTKEPKKTRKPKRTS
jgi:transcriptional regulator with XRE-family HTH domain